MMKSVIILIEIVLIAANLTFSVIEGKRIKEIEFEFHEYNSRLAESNKIIGDYSRENSILINNLTECTDRAWRIEGLIDALGAKINNVKIKSSKR